MEDFSGAAAALETALARDPRNAEWHYRLGVTRARMEDWPDAAAAFEAALAREDRNGEWHYRLGLARANMGDWRGAAAAYEAALARDTNKAKWHLSLGVVRVLMQDWVVAADAYRSALDLDVCNDLCRSRLSFCLLQSGNESDAQTVLAPLVAKSDAHLDQFLFQRSDRARVLEKRVLRPHMMTGIKTTLARRISIQYDSGSNTYFEHLKIDKAGNKRVSAFYSLLQRAFGDDIPDFIPRLHYSATGIGYWYFLYDYLDGASLHALEDTSDVDMQLGAQAVDCLVQISCRLQGVFDKSVRAQGLACAFATCDVQKYLAKEIGRNQHDSAYATTLKDLSKRWGAHSSGFEKIATLPCHGDLHGGNLIVSNNGHVSVLDWERYGWAPMGVDLVRLFWGKLECAQFEQLLDRYFDGLPVFSGTGERRYIVALLAVLTSVVSRTPTPKKWVQYLSG